MLCCLLCLTVCVVPALAGNYNDSDGIFQWSADSDITVTNSGKSYSVLNGYFPASFSGRQDSNNAHTLLVVGSAMPVGSSNSWNATVPGTFYVDILYPVDAPIDITRKDSIGDGYVLGSLFFGPAANLTGESSNYVYAADMALLVDDDRNPLPSGTASHSFVVSAGTFHVNRQWGFRLYFNRFGLNWRDTVNQALKVRFIDYYQYFTDSDYLSSIYDNLVINTGILTEINGSVKDIQLSTAQIQADVSEIKNGLQDSNSSIWGAFKDSVSGLFVPSSGDLEGVKNGFDQLAQDKLGGAYTAAQFGTEVGKIVRDKFKNPVSSPGVEFPGISVPLGGDVGTVTLAASQIVTIPDKIANVLYPVSGVIIPVVCSIWTLRLCIDMVNCFMSGMSYGEFLHRHSEEEDNEV